MGKSLPALRMERGMTQRQIAGMLGITAAAYCRKEKGVRPLFVSELQKLAKIFDVTLNDIELITPQIADVESQVNTRMETS